MEINNMVWKTCPHCNSKFTSNKDLGDGVRFCPMCNMNKEGVDKDKLGDKIK